MHDPQARREAPPTLQLPLIGLTAADTPPRRPAQAAGWGPEDGTGAGGPVREVRLPDQQLAGATVCCADGAGSPQRRIGFCAPDRCSLRGAGAHGRRRPTPLGPASGSRAAAMSSGRYVVSATGTYLGAMPRVDRPARSGHFATRRRARVRLKSGALADPGGGGDSACRTCRCLANPLRRRETTDRGNAGNLGFVGKREMGGNELVEATEPSASGVSSHSDGRPRWSCWARLRFTHRCTR